MLMIRKKDNAHLSMRQQAKVNELSEGTENDSNRAVKGARMSQLWR
jgi:hypothetical protein